MQSAQKTPLSGEPNLSFGNVRYISDVHQNEQLASGTNLRSFGGESVHPSTRLPIPPSFSSLKQRWESGSVFCKTIFYILPESMTWVRLCILNHLMHWILLVLVLVHRIPGNTYAMACLLVAALVNGLCLIVDGLTGYAAKGVGSFRVVEVVDHWLDAFHTPLIASTVTYSLGAPPWMIVATCSTSILVFSAQLLIFHTQRIFIDTNGLEGRLGASALFCLAALMLLWPNSHPNLSIIRQILVYLYLFALVSILKTFVSKFDSKTSLKFLQFCSIVSVPGILYLCGGLSVHQFIIIMPFLSFRLNGSYSLQIAKGDKPFFERSLGKWLISMLWGHFLCHPIPLTIVLNKDIFVYIFCMYVIRRNTRDIVKALPLLKKISKQERESNLDVKSE